MLLTTYCFFADLILTYKKYLNSLLCIFATPTTLTMFPTKENDSDIDMNSKVRCIAARSLFTTCLAGEA